MGWRHRAVTSSSLPPVAMIFAPAMFSDIEYDLEQKLYTPLQTSYRFERNPESGNHVNRNWMRVNYQNDFTITIE